MLMVAVVALGVCGLSALADELEAAGRPSEEAKPTVAEGPSVINVHVALLKDVGPLAGDSSLDWYVRYSRTGQGWGLDIGPNFAPTLSELAGDRIIHEPNAGLVTIINPDVALWTQFFRPARDDRSGSLADEHGSVKVGEERSFDLVWPPGRPQYYLEKVEQDVYHRVAVADKEGYTVTVRPTGAAPDFTVALELARNTFTRGKYDETIRAFVGQPSLLKTVLTSQAPLTSGQQTLLVWLPRPEAQVVAPVAGAAPSWAVGEWEMTGPGEETGLLTVKADGSVLWTSGTNRREPPGEPHLMYGPGTIDSSGQVEIKVALGGEEMTLTGKLNPDGTATGGLSPLGMAWTATKDRRPATEQGAPAWAVGEWTFKTSGSNDLFTADVLPDGTVLGHERPNKTGKGTIDPSGQVEYRVTYWNWAATMTGKLTPEGTGGGTIREEAGTALSPPDFGAFWTAKQSLQPIPYTAPPAPEPVRAAPGAPPWAVGEWLLETSRRKYFTVNVLPSGTVLCDERENRPGKGTIDPSGQIEYRATYGNWVGTMTGILTPEGTGGGTIHEEGAVADSVSDFGAFWTAGRIGRPIPYGEPPVPEPVRAVPIPQAAPGPAGVAVLLEVGPADEAAEIPEEITALIEQPGPLIQIEARFVEVEIKKDAAFGIDWFVANGSAEFFNLGFAPRRGIKVARFRKGRFEKELRTLLSEGRAQLSWAPRVTTRNNLPATVDLSREIPSFYATITYDEFGKREVEYQTETVAITQSLTVTPRILQDGSVELLLEGEIEDQVGTMIGPNGEVLPVVNAQAFYSQVRVADGETIVIGGLTRTPEVVDPKQVLPPEATAETEQPEVTKRVRKELLIFVTPRILSEIPPQ